MSSNEPTQPPFAERRPQERVHHGDVFVDPYEWLRAKDDDAVIAYLEAENAWTRRETSHLIELSEEIFHEIKARTKQTDLSVPTYRTHTDGSAYWYYVRTVEGSEYPIYCRTAASLPDGPDGAPKTARTPPDTSGTIEGEQVLLDANSAASDHDFFAIGAFAVSPNGRLLAYSTDTTGAERFTLRIVDLVRGDLLADTLHDTAYGVAWAGDDYLVYTCADEAWRPYLVLRHRLATDPADDAVVWEEPDERFWLGVEASRDRRWIVFGAGSKITSEARLLDVDDPEGTPRAVAPRRHGVEYEVEPAGDRLLIVHNDGALDFELAWAPLDATSHEQWIPVLPHQAGTRILGVQAFARHAVVSLRRDGLTGLHVLRRDDSAIGFGSGVDVTFAEPLYSVESAGSPEYDTDTVRLSYESMVTPESVYDYALDTCTLSLLKQTPVLDDPTWGPYDPANYAQERGWATAADGTRIPISIVYRADVPRDGSAPALLYGYGSYEIPIDPTFSIPRLSLQDRGIVFAIAHIRGGGELGRGWYEQGKLLAKRNTFTDFVTCARWLVEERYTATDRLAARGGSAGGLLMGAVANLAPDAFRAIHAQVPFVDALTTILDPDLPLTVIEWEEWGDPLHSAEAYAYMKSYSPYENVRATAYPAILATTSLNDTRVFYVEPAKWIAALRAVATNAGDRPILLKTEMVAGHGGVSGRYQSWQETAFEYAWIIDQITP
jgi:oligopeptidase B